MFIREVGIDQWIGNVEGKSHDKFCENERFLALGCGKFKIVFLKDDDPSSKFTVNLSTTEQVLHGVGICDNFGSSKQDVMAQFLDCEG